MEQKDIQTKKTWTCPKCESTSFTEDTVTDWKNLVTFYEYSK